MATEASVDNSKVEATCQWAKLDFSCETWSRCKAVNHAAQWRPGDVVMDKCDGVRANELLNELGALMLKHKCIELMKQGYTREEVNMMMEQRFVPELNDWMSHILQGFMHDETSAGHTVN
jgi:hypothetical protein